MLLATAAAGYLSGVMAYQFLNAAGLDPEAVLTQAAHAAGAQFMIGAVVMVASLVAALMAARAVLLGAGIANPFRRMRGAMILSIVGGVLTLALSLPGIFLIFVAGLAWLAYILFDETYNPVPHSPAPPSASRIMTRGGDLSDWS